MRALQLVTAAAVLLTTANPAIAVDAVCLRRNLPAAMQRRIFEAYAAHGREGLDNVDISDAQVFAGLKACRVAPDSTAPAALGVTRFGLSSDPAWIMTTSPGRLPEV